MGVGRRGAYIQGFTVPIHYCCICAHRGSRGKEARHLAAKVGKPTADLICVFVSWRQEFRIFLSSRIYKLTFTAERVEIFFKDVLMMLFAFFIFVRMCKQQLCKSIFLLTAEYIEGIWP